jgi:hypothetical protein
VLVAGDRADEDLGIWRKPAAAAAAVVVRAERERERERARAGRTNSPVGELFGREERNRTGLLLDWTWAVNCSNIFFRFLLFLSFSSFLVVFIKNFFYLLFP